MSGRLRLVGLIAMIGFQLRAPILGVPPVLPDVRDDLHLSFTAAGTLTALPVLCLGAAAVPGAVLVDRFGARRVIGAATVGLGLAALLRLAPPVPGALYFFTALMALCAAVAQPAMAVVVRAWFPHAVQRASTIFTSALSLGGLSGATLSLRLLALGGWRASFAVWALVALVAGGLWLAAAPHRNAGPEPGPAGLRELVRDPGVWHVAALFGSQSLIYYGAASWIPFEIRSQGPGFLALVVLLLNVVGLPVGLVLVVLPWPWARSRRFYALAGTLLTVATAGFAVGLTGLAWLWAIILGVGGGMTFAGSIALPALFARSHGHVAGYAALVLTVGYAISFGGPFLGGLLLDQTHRVTSPFWLMTAFAVALLGLGLALPRRGPLAVPDDAQAA